MHYAEETVLTACHEIGHALIALEVGVKIIHVTIRGGNEYTPQMRFDNTSPISRSDMFDVLLAGWSAEAYYVSHGRDAASFDSAAFIAALPSTGTGVGRRLGVFVRSRKDVPRSVRLHPIKAVFRTEAMLAIAQRLHARRLTFFSMVDEILEEYELTGKRVHAIFEGSSSTEATRKLNRRNELNAALGLPLE